MNMPVHTITGLWRRAPEDKKKEQLGILAQLCGCSKGDMFEFLLLQSEVKEADREGLITVKHNKKWTIERDGELIAMYNDGMRIIKIAEKMGITQNSVRGRMRYLIQMGKLQPREKGDYVEECQRKSKTDILAAELERLTGHTLEDVVEMLKDGAEFRRTG